MLDRKSFALLQRREFFVYALFVSFFVALLEGSKGNSVVGQRSNANKWSDELRASGLPLLFPVKYRKFNLSLVTGSENLERRYLVGNARSSLYGEWNQGSYFAELYLGTPQQKFDLIVDTGSGVTFVPCAKCQKCGKGHLNKAFAPQNSSTYVNLKCTDAACQDIPRARCGDNNFSNSCHYALRYQEGSSWSGKLGMDVINFRSTSDIGKPLITFACATEETGMISRQLADGNLGLSRDKLSIPVQLASAKVIDDSFSLCYADESQTPERGGALIMGSTGNLEGTVWVELDPTAIDDPTHYAVKMEGIRVQGGLLPIQSLEFEGAIIDSGTTYNYLPQEAYKIFIGAVTGNLSPSLEPVPAPNPLHPDDVCFGGATKGHLEDYFPSVDFLFSPGAVVSLSPENYMFRSKIPGVFCVGVFPGDRTLLGGIFARNFLVTYDIGNRRVGFLKTRCDRLMDEWPNIPAAEVHPGYNSSSSPVLQPPPKSGWSGPPPVTARQSLSPPPITVETGVPEPSSPEPPPVSIPPVTRPPPSPTAPPPQAPSGPPPSPTPPPLRAPIGPNGTTGNGGGNSTSDAPILKNCTIKASFITALLWLMLAALSS